MNAGKNAKILFFHTVAVVFLAVPQKGFATDSFVNPADNAYSLKKVLTRPFLQKMPIPQVWQTDSKSEKFRRAWLNALTPQTKAERQLESVSWQLEAQDRLRDFEKTTKTDPQADWSAVSEILNALIPIVEQAEVNAVFSADRQDDLYMRDRIRHAAGETDKMARDMFNFQAFLLSLNETARTDMELELLASQMRQSDQKTDNLFAKIGHSLLSEAILKNAEDIYAPETRQIRGLKEIDDVLSALLINDMMDLSTGLIMLSRDEMFPDQPVAATRRSASLLDRTQKNDQILKADPVSRRKAFFRRLEKFLKGNNTKDVK